MTKWERKSEIIDFFNSMIYDASCVILVSIGRYKYRDTGY